MTALYLDTSAVLRSILESGTSPEIETRIADARVLVTSRLSLVESARALIRVRDKPEVAPLNLADAERELSSLWVRCELWELTPSVCELACHVSPRLALRTVDALHLATFLMARRNIEELQLITVDDRLAKAAASA